MGFFPSFVILLTLAAFEFTAAIPNIEPITAFADDGSILVSEAQPSRPDVMDAFLDARDKCNQGKKYKWELYGPSTECDGAHVWSCNVPMTLEEGEGIMTLAKIGPFTTTGGIQNFMCTGQAPAPVKKAYLTRVYSLVSDPHTGYGIGYPPVHFHHGYMATNEQYLPILPEELKLEMPWIMDDFNCGTSSCECTEALGGVACYSRKLPAGQALKQYRPGKKGGVRTQFEDIRAANSPPISMLGEFGQFLLTKPSTPIEQIVGVAHFAVGGLNPPYVYDLPYGKEAYITGTYWIPIRMKLTNVNIHTHAQDGDEIWTIRGSEEDMGVPPSQRSYIYAKKGEREDSGNGMLARREVLAYPVSVDVGGLDEVKRNFENALKEVGRQWEEENNCPGCDSIPHLTDKENYFLHFDPTKTVRRTRKPKLLCKYYSVVEVLDADDIARKEATFQNAMANDKPVDFGKFRFVSNNEDERRLLEEIRNASTLTSTTASSKRGLKSDQATYQFDDDDWKESTPDITGAHKPGTIVNGEMYKGPEVQFEADRTTGYRIYSKNHDPPLFEINRRSEQYKNMFKGASPGIYYRHSISGLQAGDTEYVDDCNSFHLDAGDFFSIAGFNAVRLNPTHDENTYYDAPITGQHNRVATLIQVKDAPWYTD